MFHVYVENPVVEAPPLPSLPPTGRSVAPKLKTKLTVTGRVEGDITLAPRLPFSSFDDLKAEIQALLRPLPGTGVSLLSLAYVDSDGDLVELLESTFDPMDFDDFAGDRVVLRAKVLPKGATQGSLKRPPPAPVQGKKEHPTDKPEAPRRCALGRRDANTLAAPTPSRGLREAAQKTANQATVRSMSPAAATTVTTINNTAVQIQDRNKRGFAPRPVAARNCSSSSSFSISTSSSGSRAPQFVFGAGGGSSLKKTSNAMSRASKAPAGHAPVQATAAGNGAAAKSSTARRRRHAPAAPRRPSWDNGNEPAWEEVRYSAQRSLDAAVKAYTDSIVIPTNCCCSCLFFCRDSR